MFWGFSMGSILGGGLTAALVPRFGWRPVFLAGGALPLLLAPIMMVMLPESLPFLVAKGAKRQQILHLLRRIDPTFSAPSDVQFVTAEPPANGLLPTVLADSGLATETAILVSTLISVGVAAGFAVSGGQKSVNALAVIFYPTAVRSTGVGWALGVGRIGSIIGPILGGWLMARGWSNVNIFEFASLPMLCAALVVFAMGLRYGSNRKGYVSDKKRHAFA